MVLEPFEIGIDEGRASSPALRFGFWLGGFRGFQGRVALLTVAS